MPADIQAFFDTYLDAFNRLDGRAFLAQGDNFCDVDLAWRIERRDQAPQRFNTAYSLAKRNGTWKVAMVTAYEERRTWSEHG